MSNPEVLSAGLAEKENTMSNLKRLLVPIAVATALIVLTMPAHAQSTYTWTVTCKGAASAGFSWSWQLADGSTVAGPLLGCIAPYTYSGTATSPPTTTGITVTASITGSPGVGCSDETVTTKKVNASQSLSVTIHISVPSTATSLLGTKVNCLPGSADFKLSSP